MKQFAVSRSVVRAAVSRSQAANIVERRHGVGTFVRAPADREAVRLRGADLSDLLDVVAVIEFRIDLEGAAAALAAGRRTEQHLKQIAGALKRFEEQVANGSTDVLQHDVEFHLQIARASGNRYFYDVLSHMDAPWVRARACVGPRLPRRIRSNGCVTC